MTAQQAFELGLAPWCELPRYRYNRTWVYGEKLENGMIFYHRPDGKIGKAY